MLSTRTESFGCFRVSKNLQTVKMRIIIHENFFIDIVGNAFMHSAIKTPIVLAAQGILTYCATLPSRVSIYTSGSRCLSLALLRPLQSVKKKFFDRLQNPRPFGRGFFIVSKVISKFLPCRGRCPHWPVLPHIRQKSKIFATFSPREKALGHP